MDTYFVIIFSILFIFIGLILLANNTLNSIIVKKLFNNTAIAKFLTRLMGVCLIASTLFLITEQPTIAFSIVFFVILLFCFMTIKGKDSQKKMINEKKEEMLRSHQLEIAEKKAKINALREKVAQDNSPTTMNRISYKKKKAWNDGSLTNKELIEKFKSK